MTEHRRSAPAGFPCIGRAALPAAALVAAALLLLGTSPLQAASVVTRGPGARPWVALTFDDGWDVDRCARIAHTLRRKQATATFFINATYLGRSPTRWRSILAGFPVANHGYSHRDLTTLSRSGVRDEVLSDQRRIEGILKRPMLRLLRPPYGAYDADVLSVADALGYRLVLWNVDSGDTYGGATTSGVLSRAVTGGRGSIVLLHCGPAVTPGAVARIIDSYRSRGYRLVDLARMLGLGPTRPTRPPTACRVRNPRSGRMSRTLARAVAAARGHDRLVVTGTCQGGTTIDRHLLIEGSRIAGSGRATLDGQRRVRVLNVQRGAVVTLRGLLVERGRDPEGGGIRNAGRLRLRDVVVRDNRGQFGAGIDNRPPGLLRLAGSSVVKDNTAGREGGGLRNLGTTYDVRCGAGGNVRGNAPDDCSPAPTAPPDPEQGAESGARVSVDGEAVGAGRT